MPVRRCNENGKVGYRYGSTGKCYKYTSGDSASRIRAKRRAEAQGRAIEANKRTDNK